MTFLFFHPIKKKWQVTSYIVPHTQYNPQDYRRFSGDSDSTHGWLQESMDWTMANFVFSARLEYSGISLGRSACHILMREPATPERMANQLIFIPRTFDALFDAIRAGSPGFDLSRTGTFSGIFTFEKSGTSLFVTPYLETGMAQQELPPGYAGRM